MTGSTENRTGELDWIAFKGGDKDAFERIYRANASRLLAYGYRITSDKDVIEDSLHDLFVELWQSRERIAVTTSIRFYLFRALRYKIQRNLQRNDFKVFEDIGSNCNTLVMPPHESLLTSIELQSEQLANLNKILNGLPQRQREAVNLRYFNNFSNEEIAAIMGVNYQSACKFIYMALRKLRENLRVAVSSFLILLNFF